MSQAELGSSRTRYIGSRTEDPGGARVMSSKGQETKHGRSARDNTWSTSPESTSGKCRSMQAAKTWKRQRSRLEGWGPEV